MGVADIHRRLASVSIEETDSAGSLRTEFWQVAKGRGLDATERFFFVDKLLKEFGRNSMYEDDARLYVAREGGDVVGAAFTYRAHDGKTFIDGIGSLETGHGVGTALLNAIRKNSPNGIIGSAWPGSEGFWSGQGMLEEGQTGKGMPVIRGSLDYDDILRWKRISPGHYDSSDGQWRIDTCDTNKARWDLFRLTENVAMANSWEEIGCYPSLISAQKDAQQESQNSGYELVEPDEEIEDDLPRNEEGTIVLRFKR